MREISGKKLVLKVIIFVDVVFFFVGVVLWMVGGILIAEQIPFYEPHEVWGFGVQLSGVLITLLAVIGGFVIAILYSVMRYRKKKSEFPEELEDLKTISVGWPIGIILMGIGGYFLILCFFQGSYVIYALSFWLIPIIPLLVFGLVLVILNPKVKIFSKPQLPRDGNKQNQ